MRHEIVLFLGWFALLGFASSGCTSGRAMASKEPKHHTCSGFTNLHMSKEKEDKSLWSVLKMRFSAEWADHAAEAATVPVTEVDLERLREPEQPQATWLGHSTVLIQIHGKNILTDPVFSDRASPVRFAGPRRYTPPALSVDELPPVDYVVISHNHYDHMDLDSIRAIGNSALWLVPLRNGHLLESVGVTNYIELDWWESHQVDGCTFTATPVQHWSARGLNDRFESLWSGWVVEHQEFRVYFAGDTGYNERDFRDTGARFGDFDLSLIPIGAYAPRWFMKSMHVNPEEAVKIHKDVNSRLSLGVHWGTFPLTAESPAEPPERLEKALAAEGVSPGSFLAVPIGTTTVIPKDDSDP